ncbi:MAG: NYN domain-containing protein [Bacteroidetes bacterium]|nr:NYN domain-containing protein [Bacteroidota bacterium]
MMQKNFNIAVLIDGDNAQPKLLKEILEEVAKYGKATIRRIYGDWTTNQMKGWKDVINLYSFNPIQKFSYTKGKNSTDSSLIIDAMDVLHEKNIDGFCIVSSDSDYTGLAKRIREHGVFVMGIGKKSTPMAFIQSCEIFTFCEHISAEPLKEEPTKSMRTRTNAKLEEKTPEPQKSNLKHLDKAFDISVGEDEETTVAQIGINLRKIDPSFDARDFGCKNLTQLFRNLPNYEVINHKINGLNQPLIKRK